MDFSIKFFSHYKYFEMEQQSNAMGYKNEIYMDAMEELDEIESYYKFYRVYNTPSKYIPIELKTLSDLKDQVNEVVKNYMKINLQKIKSLNDEILLDSAISNYHVSLNLDKVKVLCDEIDLGYSDVYSRSENIMEEIQILIDDLNGQFNHVNSESDEDYIPTKILKKKKIKLDLIGNNKIRK